MKTFFDEHWESNLTPVKRSSGRSFWWVNAAFRWAGRSSSEESSATYAQERLILQKIHYKRRKSWEAALSKTISVVVLESAVLRFMSLSIWWFTCESGETPVWPNTAVNGTSPNKASNIQRANTPSPTTAHTPGTSSNAPTDTQREAWAGAQRGRLLSSRVSFPSTVQTLV